MPQISSPPLFFDDDDGLIALSSLNVRGQTTIVMGSGDDRVAYDGVPTGKSEMELSIDLGAGDDRLAVDVGIKVKGKFEGGSGYDQLGSNAIGTRLTVRGIENSVADSANIYADVGTDVKHALRDELLAKH